MAINLNQYNFLLSGLCTQNGKIEELEKAIKQAQKRVKSHRGALEKEKKLYYISQRDALKKEVATAQKELAVRKDAFEKWRQKYAIFDQQKLDLLAPLQQQIVQFLQTTPGSICKAESGDGHAFYTFKNTSTSIWKMAGVIAMVPRWWMVSPLPTLTRTVPGN